MADQGGSHKKLSNGLVALSSAAVLAVYTAGYLRTKPAAERFAIQAATRRPGVPAPSMDTSVSSPLPGPAIVAAGPRSETAAPLSGKAPLIAPDPTGPGTAPIRKARKPARAARPSVETEKTPTIVSSPAVEVSTAVTEQAAPIPVPAAPAPPKPQYKDGTYLGWGTSRHGDIQAQVVIEGGRIASATIAQCLTRYSCSVIAQLPPQVAARQSPETDYVSGATQSTNAFYYAVVEALSKAK